MSTSATCELQSEAITVVRHTLERDLNSRGWLKHGYVFYVQDVSEVGVEVLVVHSGSGAIDLQDVFPVRLQLAWEDIKAHTVKNKLIDEIGLDNARLALAGDFRTDSPGRPPASHSAYTFRNRLWDRVSRNRR